MFESLTDFVSGSPWTYAFLFAIAAIDVVFPLVPSETLPVPPPALAAEPDAPPQPPRDAPEARGEPPPPPPRPRARPASSVARTSALALFGYVCMFHLSVSWLSPSAPAESGC